MLAAVCRCGNLCSPSPTTLAAVVQDKTTGELLRAVIVFEMSRIRPLVRNGDRLMKLCDKLLPAWVLDTFLRVRRRCQLTSACAVLQLTVCLLWQHTGDVLWALLCGRGRGKHQADDLDAGSAWHWRHPGLRC